MCPTLRSQSDHVLRRQAMEPAAYAKIRRNPKFVELVRQRGAFARNLTIAMLVIYFGFILLVAFAKGFLGHADQRGLGHDHRHPDRPVRHRLGVRADRHLRQQGQHHLRRAQRPDPGGEQVMRAASACSLAGLVGTPRRCGAGLGGRRDRGRHHHPADQLDRHRHVLRLRAVHAGDHQVGGLEDQVGGRLLRRRRRHHRLPEQPRDRRRLHVGGLVPGHLGPGVRLGLSTA